MPQAAVIAILLLGGGVLVLAFIFLLRTKRPKPFGPDDLEGHDFELYCAQLLKEQGFYDVHVTPGSRDFGADILCFRDGVSYAVQCKRYDHPVGIFAVQEVYAARDYYDCMVGVVMTNSVFTEPAEKMAEKLRILLWDRSVLQDMDVR
jgi:restriction system protein